MDIDNVNIVYPELEIRIRNWSAIKSRNITRNTHCAERLARQDMYAVCMLCVASRKVKYYNLNLLCA